jgi:hypothetical protein
MKALDAKAKAQAIESHVSALVQLLKDEPDEEVINLLDVLFERIDLRRGSRAGTIGRP